MTQYNPLNVNLYKSKLKKLKLGIKNNTEVNLELLSNVIGDSSDENNFPHKLLLINPPVSTLWKAFANNSSANVNYQKLNCIN